MKMIAFTLVIMSIFGAGIALGNDLICRDDYEKGFEGSLYLVMNQKIIQEVRYAKLGVNDKSQYVRVKSFVPNTANKNMKSGSEYKVEILTSMRLLKGKLSLNLFGDQLDLSTDEEHFVLTCNEI